MKKCFFFLALLSLIACGNDNGLSDDVLRYDGENANSPIFPAGNHEAAVRFPSFVTNEYLGRGLSSIEVYVYNVPQSFSFNVYTSGSAAGPNNLLLTEEVSSQIQADGIIALIFDPPIEITGELWLSVSWTSINAEQVIGCDAGPANVNGDWLFLSSDQEGWSSFRERGGESVNWNIRGLVTDL